MKSNKNNMYVCIYNNVWYEIINTMGYNFEALMTTTKTVKH